MSGKDYAPPGQHTITDFPAKQDRVEPMPRAQQYIPPGQQPTAPPMRQQQYMVNGQAMPQQQQYYQQQQQQQMPQNYQTGQHYTGGVQPMQSAIGSPAPFLNTPLQPWSTELFDCAHDIENGKSLNLMLIN